MGQLCRCFLSVKEYLDSKIGPCNCWLNEYLMVRWDGSANNKLKVEEVVELKNLK